MCMKTKDNETKCLNRNRHLVLNVRHLGRTDTHFAENCCFYTTVCQSNPVFCGFRRACSNPYAKYERRPLIRLRLVDIPMVFLKSVELTAFHPSYS